MNARESRGVSRLVTNEKGLIYLGNKQGLSIVNFRRGGIGCSGDVGCSGNICYKVLHSVLPCITQGKEYNNMTRDKESSRNPVGRPAKPMPPPIPDTPENVAKSVLFTPPKRDEDWEYLDRKDRTKKVQAVPQDSR